MPPRRPLSVLVVDDHRDAANSTAALLSLSGHDARAAYGGEDALRAADDRPPDVVVLDLRMPGLDGCEVARRLAARRSARPPVVVAVTGSGRPADRASAAAAGCHLYLVKPVDPALLVGLMGRFQDAFAPDDVPAAAGGSNDTGPHQRERSVYHADDVPQ